MSVKVHHKVDSPGVSLRKDDNSMSPHHCPRLRDTWRDRELTLLTFACEKVRDLIDVTFSAQHPLFFREFCCLFEGTQRVTKIFRSFFLFVYLNEPNSVTQYSDQNDLFNSIIQIKSDFNVTFLQLKSKVVNIFTKTTVLRINLNIDDDPIPSHTHTHFRVPLPNLSSLIHFPFLRYPIPPIHRRTTECV